MYVLSTIVFAGKRTAKAFAILQIVFLLLYACNRSLLVCNNVRKYLLQTHNFDSCSSLSWQTLHRTTP